MCRQPRGVREADTMIRIVTRDGSRVERAEIGEVRCWHASGAEITRCFQRAGISK